MTDLATEFETLKLESESKLPPQDHMSLEALLLLIHKERLQTLRDQAAKEFEELNERQEKVKTLHDTQKAINSATQEKGTLDLKGNDELKDLLAQE